MVRKILAQRRDHSRQAGIALLEALLSLGLVTGGVIASLAFNANVVSVSTTTRVSSAALAAAQAKLEELRNVDYPAIVSGDDTVDFNSPGFIGQSSITVKRCWLTEDVMGPDGVTPIAGILELTVAATGGADDCDASDGGSPVRLSALIAQADPRLAATNVADLSGADGNAEKVNALPDSVDNLTPTNNSGGFQIYKDGSGKILAIASPSGGSVLVPKEGSDLKYTTISGNIIFRGARSIAEARLATVGGEGNVICRTYWPDIEVGQNSSTTPPTPVVPPPALIRNGETITYIQYSCIAADGWRRAIYLLTRNPTRSPKDKVCVGFPSQQGTATTDVLLSPGRQYLGRNFDEVDPTLKVFTGVRGAADDSSQIGSVCQPGQHCYEDESEFGARGWVPGGHHFTVVDKGETEGADVLCSTQMEAMFRAIDQVDPTDDATQDRVYRNYLFRNPQKVACINNKNYNDQLDIIPFDETTTDCYSTTKVGGFLTPIDSATINPFNIRFGANAPLLVPCLPAGAFGNPGGASRGGAYLCGFPDLPGEPEATDKSLFVNITANGFLFGYGVTAGAFQNQSLFDADGVTVFQGAAAPVLPEDRPHDYTGVSFSYISNGGVCSSATLNWTGSNGETCSAVAPETNNSTQVTVSSTTGGSGSATYSCSASVFTLASSTCTTAVVEPTLTCPNFIINGSRKNGVAVSMTVAGNPATCTFPTNNSYSCSRANVAVGDSYTLRHPGSGANNKTELGTVSASGSTPICNVGINF